MDSWLFRIERWILSKTHGTRTTRDDVHALAYGSLQSFALWTEHTRDDTQLCLEVKGSPVRTCLMVEHRNTQTHLYFGTGLVPTSRDPQKPPTIPWGFRALTGVHLLYARMLLRAGAANLA